MAVALEQASQVRLGLERPSLLLATAIQLINKNELFRAEDLIRRVLAGQPDHALALSCLGSTLERLGDLDNSLDAFKRAVDAAPENPVILSNYIFALDRHPSITLEQAHATRRRYNALVVVPQTQPHANDRDPDRVLRVGYVSGDVRQHSAMFGCGPVLLSHDPSAVETHVYSVTPESDWLTEAIRNGVPHFRPCSSDTDDELEAKIRADQIDVLVDLSGHSAGNRLAVFARKPAPVQVSAWGYASGAGIDAMDYLFSDDVLISPDEEQWYAEKIVRLPRCMPYWPTDPSEVGEVTPLPALTNGYLTFGVFQRLGKLHDECLALWSRVLAAVPDSKLIVKASGFEHEPIRDHFLSRLDVAGFDRERVLLLGSSKHDDHMRAYGRVDLVLDPWPDGGGISTLEAAWMGVPTLTAPWHQISSRATASVNRELGLDCLTVRTPTEYVARAVTVSEQIDTLADIRSWMRDLMTASAFCSHAAYTRVVEREYRAMWRRYLDTAAPTPPPPLRLV